jgi:hypothetical protein
MRPTGRWLICKLMYTKFHITGLQSATFGSETFCSCGKRGFCLSPTPKRGWKQV